MWSQHNLRDQLVLVEGQLNRLFGVMSPQLETELDYRRHILLKQLLKAQLLDFDTHPNT